MLNFRETKIDFVIFIFLMILKIEGEVGSL